MLLPLHDQHGRHHSAGVPIRRIDLLDSSNLGLAIIQELNATVEDRAPTELPFADVGRDHGARTLEMNVGAEGHRSPIASLIISYARPGCQVWFRYFPATASAAKLMRAAA